MQIDFSAVRQGEMKLVDLANQYTVDDLRTVAHTSVDTLLDMIKGLDDAGVTFDPEDPEANDPYAVEGEEEIGWSVAHLVAHVTASSEEGAAFSSLLARGIPAKERPRYETPWREVTTKAHCVQRLEESRRIRLAYLDTWPDEPFLDVHRDVSERFSERFGPMNAPTAFLFGLMHEVGHYNQIRDVIQQVLGSKK